uniref:NAD-dependent epimerase/dehydratase domain-containing protein n=1 Tax=Wuchereria bancrofti TaxID=6293 RepID=A0AAF5PL93_WUCBA
MSAKTQLNNSTSENNNCHVLITGASGYLAMHLHGTLRDLNCPEKVNPSRQLANSDQLLPYYCRRWCGSVWKMVWQKALNDCIYVLHIASPCEVITNKAIIEIMTIGRFMDGSMPAYPLIKLSLIVVRDAARAHILAMKETKYNGRRILITFCSLINKIALQALSLYGHEDNFDNSKAFQLLGMLYQNVRIAVRNGL